MPPQPAQSQEDQQTAPVAAQRGPSGVSRRSLLRGAAGVGAAGIAAAGGVGAAVALTRPTPRTAGSVPADATKPVAALPPNATDGPLVVYLRDTTTGELDIFAGTGQVRLHDPALVGQLLRAIP